jgi:hypothetical protein
MKERAQELKAAAPRGLSPAKEAGESAVLAKRYATLGFSDKRAATTAPCGRPPWL